MVTESDLCRKVEAGCVVLNDVGFFYVFCTRMIMSGQFRLGSLPSTF